MYHSNFRLQVSDCKFENLQSTSAIFLPARLHDAGNLSLQRQFAKTDAAQVELA